VVTSDAVWSPDGRHIAVCIITPPPVSSTALAVFDAKSGDRKDLIVRKNGFYNGLAWKGDGSGLLMTGADLELGFTNQLVEVSYPQGQMGRITNDFNQYNEPSVTTSGDIIAVLGTSTLSNIYSAGLDQTPAALTRATARENAPMQFAVSERHIFYNIIRDRNLRLFSMPLAGGDGRIFGTAGSGHVVAIKAAADRVVFAVFNDGQQHIWTARQDGSGMKQLTSFAGENLHAISPDGLWISFSRSDSARGIWIAPTGGGEPRLIAPAGQIGLGAFSHDGRYLAVAEYGENEAGLLDYSFVGYPVQGDAPLLSIARPARASDPEWQPDAAGISFIDRGDPAWNVYRANFDGSNAQRITRFADDRVVNHAWSADGKRLAVVRRAATHSNVWIVDIPGGDAHPVTTFTSDQVFEMEWVPGSKNVIVRAGELARDVVLVRDFR
jgi:Tol biopolymer transport system component